MKEEIRIGDVVERTHNDYRGMFPGDVDEVIDISPSGALTLEQYGAGHWDINFKIVEHCQTSEISSINLEDTRYGKKYDKGKLLMRPLFKSLILPLKGVAAVLTYGAQKYEEESWQQVPDGHKRYEDAFYRHMTARNEGEIYDKESGLPHLAHMLCNLMFIFWFEVQEGIIGNITRFNQPKT